ncbi:MAG: glycosyltransferase family 39 protein [Chloroflexi bacterium]|nr:glycosyltransferase family 39 protein [Chloroflexota bacterium]
MNQEASLNKPEKKQPFVKKIDLLLLLIFTLLLMGNQILWISSDMTPPHGYPMGHIDNSFNISQLLRTGNIAEILKGYYIYPFVAHTYSGIFYFVSGLDYSIFSARLSLIFLLPIYIYFTFLIGLNIGGRAAAWLSAITAACAPLILQYLQEYYLEFPLAVILIVCVYLLLKTDNLENKKYCILLGVFSGIGFLVKMNFLFYFTLLIALTAVSNTKLWRLSLISILSVLTVTVILIIIIKTWLVHPPMHLVNFIHIHPVLSYFISFLICICLFFLLYKIEKKLSPKKKEQHAPIFGLLNFTIFFGAVISPWFIGILPAFQSYRYIMSKVLPPPPLPLSEIMFKQLGLLNTVFPGALFFLILGFVIFIYLSLTNREFAEKYNKYNIILSMFFVIVGIQALIIFKLKHVSMEYPVPTIAMLSLCSFFYVDRIKFSFIRSSLILIMGLFAIWSATAWLLPDWIPNRVPFKYFKAQSFPRILFEPENFNFRFQLFDAVADRITNRILEDAHKNEKINFAWIFEGGEFATTQSFQAYLQFQCIRKGIKICNNYIGPDPENFYKRAFSLEVPNYILVDIDYVKLYHLSEDPGFIENPDKFKLKDSDLNFEFIGKYKILLHLQGKLDRPPIPMYLYRVVKKKPGS